MEKKVRVLHIFGIMNMGGAETLIMNVYRKVDRDRIQFDFLVHTDKEGFFDKEISRMGGKIFHIPNYTVLNHFAYIKAVDNFFREYSSQYDLVHCHIRSTSAILAKAAEKYGLKCILHAHSISNGTGIKASIKDTLQKKASNYSNLNLACSKTAGDWQFGGADFQILHNGIDEQKFQFSMKDRVRLRDEYNVGNKTIIGNIARFSPEKNHFRMLEIFSIYERKNPNSELWFIGDGELRVKIEALAADKGLKEKVRFLGVREDIGALLSAIDIFLFLSKYEGLGISLIEAQCSGLPCIISEGIPQEAILNKMQTYLIKTKDTEEQILAIFGKSRKSTITREIAGEILINNQYTLTQTTKNIIDFYEDVLGKKV